MCTVVIPCATLIRQNSDAEGNSQVHAAEELPDLQ